MPLNGTKEYTFQSTKPTTATGRVVYTGPVFFLSYLLFVLAIQSGNSKKIDLYCDNLENKLQALK